MHMSPSVSFAVEKIIDVVAVEGNVKNFKVQWAPTWVSSLNLVGCENLIKQFFSQRFGECKCLDGIFKVPVDFTVEENLSEDIPSAREKGNVINKEESMKEIPVTNRKNVDGIMRKPFQDCSQRKYINPTQEHEEEFTNIMEQGISISISNSILKENQNPSLQDVEPPFEITDITTCTSDENVELQDGPSSREGNKYYLEGRKHNHADGKAFLIDNSIFTLPKVPIVHNEITFGGKETCSNEHVKLKESDSICNGATSKVLREHISTTENYNLQQGEDVIFSTDLANSKYETNTPNVPMGESEGHVDLSEGDPEILEGSVKVLAKPSLPGVHNDSQQADQDFKQELASATTSTNLPVVVNLSNHIKSSLVDNVDNVDNEGSLDDKDFEIDKCIKLEDVENCNNSLLIWGPSSSATNNDGEGSIKNIVIETVLAESTNCSENIQQDLVEEANSPGVPMMVLENLANISAGSTVAREFAIQSVENIKSEDITSSNYQCSGKSKSKLSPVTSSNDPGVSRRINSEKRAAENRISKHPIKQRKIIHQKKEYPLRQNKLSITKGNSQFEGSQFEGTSTKKVFGKQKAVHKSSAQNNRKDKKTVDLKGKKCGRSYKHKSLYKCEICLLTFNSKYKFTRHKLIHSSLRNFKCRVCSQTFRRNDNLTQHMLIHGDPKFQCKTCFMKFFRKDFINRHSCKISS